MQKKRRAKTRRFFLFQLVIGNFGNTQLFLFVYPAERHLIRLIFSLNDCAVSRCLQRHLLFNRLVTVHARLC